MTDLPEPIRAFVEATNRGDARGVVESFAEDATLIDWDRHFAGHAGIASWDATDNTGVKSRMEVLGVQPSANGIVATIRVSGNGFNGTGHLAFTLSGSKIRHLLIQ